MWDLYIPFLFICNIMYSILKKKSEQQFFCFEPSIHTSGNFLALYQNLGGKD